MNKVIDELLIEATILGMLDEGKYEKDAVELIVNQLGSEYGLAAMSTANNIANIGGTEPDIIAKEVSKLFNTSVKVVKPNQQVKWNSGKEEKISSQLWGLHFTYNNNIINLKLSKGSGKSEVPKDAAFYEMGICVEYNKIKGMSQAEAMKKAKVDPKSYKAYQNYLTEVCGKVAKNMGNVGKSLEQTGGESFPPDSAWPSSDGTPKTDIYGGKGHRISVKKKGGSQLISGKGVDAKGVFIAGKASYEKYEKRNVDTKISDMIKNIDRDFKSFNTARSVGDIRKSAGIAYVKERTPEIKKQIKSKKIKLDTGQSAEKMARAEAMGAGIIGEQGQWPKWFIKGVKKISSREMNKWFSSYVETQKTKELKEEVFDVIKAAIDHKRLDGEFAEIFNDKQFKKWCVFEAATGNYKFSGDAAISSIMPIANEILVFGTDGSAQMSKIDAKWALKYADKVTPSVSFKSSGRGKYTSFRLMSEVKNIIEEEAEDFILDTSHIINEVSFADLKATGKKIIKNIKDMITNFYQKILKRVIDKMKAYAKKGLDAFSELLGIEISGKANLSINF